VFAVGDPKVNHLLGSKSEEESWTNVTRLGIHDNIWPSDIIIAESSNITFLNFFSLVSKPVITNWLCTKYGTVVTGTGDGMVAVTHRHIAAHTQILKIALFQRCGWVKLR
jgi:hypothetical protein